MKPQLLAPAVAACTVDAVIRRRPALVAGLASAAAAGVLGGAALHPAGLAPNLVGARWPVAAFPVAGMAVAAAIAIRLRVTAERLLCTLVPLSIVSAPYLWTHDLALLLPVWLVLAAAAYRRWRERAASLMLAAQAVVCAAPLAAAREDLFAAFAPLVWGAFLLWPARAVRAATDPAALGDS